tara:strand:- start:303 stop:650 length:348 start_codon:yes stop_codon:yes gene_type:complete
MLRNLSLFVCVITLLVASPLNVLAAEILQVRSSSLLQIGDRNRSYTVKIACIEVAPSDESEAIDLIKSELKRGKRINFRPVGSIDGILLAKVNSIDGKLDLAKTLADHNLASLTC